MPQYMDVSWLVCNYSIVELLLVQMFFRVLNSLMLGTVFYECYYITGFPPPLCFIWQKEYILWMKDSTIQQQSLTQIIIQHLHDLAVYRKIVILNNDRRCGHRRPQRDRKQSSSTLHYINLHEDSQFEARCHSQSINLISSFFKKKKHIFSTLYSVENTLLVKKHASTRPWRSARITQ